MRHWCSQAPNKAAAGACVYSPWSSSPWWAGLGAQIPRSLCTAYNSGSQGGPQWFLHISERKEVHVIKASGKDPPTHKPKVTHSNNRWAEHILSGELARSSGKGRCQPRTVPRKQVPNGHLVTYCDQNHPTAGDQKTTYHPHRKANYTSTQAWLICKCATAWGTCMLSHDLGPLCNAVTMCSLWEAYFSPRFQPAVPYMDLYSDILFVF